MLRRRTAACTRCGGDAQMMRIHRWLGSMLLAAVASLALEALAQSFPSKTVRIYAPFSAGAGPVTLTRVLAEKLSRLWGQPVIVEPRPGGSGFLAIEALKNATADGHEVLIASNSHVAINPALYSKLPYDADKDLVP